MPPDTRQNLVKQFVAKNPAQGKPRRLKAFNPARVSEDDPRGRWNPGLQGNRRWGKQYRGAVNYAKGRGRPD